MTEKRRSDLDIMAEILTAAREEARKTRLVYRANGNWYNIGRFIQRLIARALLVQVGPFFKTTPEGLTWLSDYKRLKMRV